VAAHEKSIVHRDIKPENVFLTRRVGCPPVCKLLDFGVSKMVGPLLGGREEDLELTRTGMVMGTPYYMSPEQARGDRNLDARVDLYACGVILYEALTGRRPFTAANYNALLLQILSTSPRSARELRPALPNGFDAVIEKAMARNRDDRYRSATEFQRDLQTLRDRHNAPMAAVVSEALRAMEFPTAKPASGARTAVPPPAPPSSPRRARDSESSIDIPITFGGDTPLSGENMPVEATQLQARPQPGDAAEFEEYPTQVQISPFDLQASPDDTQTTTTKHGPELRQQLAQMRGGGVRDTEPMGKAALAPARRAAPEAREDDTIIKPPSRKVRKVVASADDTLKVDTDASESDATQLIAPRTPKAPHR
jgi:serine/threonine protein kinase